MKTKEELRKLFENGDKPTQEHFWNWMDAYWHKEEKIPQDSIETVEKIIPLIDDNGVLSGYGRSISIPRDTKKIKNAAFQFAGSDKQIVEASFNEGLEEIGEYAFQYQSIKIIKTPSTLKIIGDYAFNYQGTQAAYGTNVLEEIILNEGLISIGDYAFSTPRGGTRILYIPDSVQAIGQDAFAIPTLEAVSAPAGLDLKDAGIPATAIITYR